jgi:hypothetical protein
MHRSILNLAMIGAERPNYDRPAITRKYRVPHSISGYFPLLSLRLPLLSTRVLKMSVTDVTLTQLYLRKERGPSSFATTSESEIVKWRFCRQQSADYWLVGRGGPIPTEAEGLLLHRDPTQRSGHSLAGFVIKPQTRRIHCGLVSTNVMS